MLSWYVCKYALILRNWKRAWSKCLKTFMRGIFSYRSVFFNNKGQTFWFPVRCLKGTLVKIESIRTHSSKNKLAYLRVLDGEWTKLWFQFFTEKKIWWWWTILIEMQIAMLVDLLKNHRRMQMAYTLVGHIWNWKFVTDI